MSSRPSSTRNLIVSQPVGSSQYRSAQQQQQIQQPKGARPLQPSTSSSSSSPAVPTSQQLLNRHHVPPSPQQQPGQQQNQQQQSSPLAGGPVRQPQLHQLVIASALGGDSRVYHQHQRLHVGGGSSSSNLILPSQNLLPSSAPPSSSTSPNQSIPISNTQTAPFGGTGGHFVQVDHLEAQGGRLPQQLHPRSISQPRSRPQSGSLSGRSGTGPGVVQHVVGTSPPGTGTTYVVGPSEAATPKTKHRSPGSEFMVVDIVGGSHSQQAPQRSASARGGSERALSTQSPPTSSSSGGVPLRGSRKGYGGGGDVGYVTVLPGRDMQPARTTRSLRIDSAVLRQRGEAPLESGYGFDGGGPDGGDGDAAIGRGTSSSSSSSRRPVNPGYRGGKANSHAYRNDCSPEHTYSVRRLNQPSARDGSAGRSRFGGDGATTFDNEFRYDDDDDQDRRHDVRLQRPRFSDGSSDPESPRLLRDGGDLSRKPGSHGRFGGSKPMRNGGNGFAYDGLNDHAGGGDDDSTHDDVGDDVRGGRGVRDNRQVDNRRLHGANRREEWRGGRYERGPRPHRRADYVDEDEYDEQHDDVMAHGVGGFHARYEDGSGGGQRMSRGRAGREIDEGGRRGEQWDREWSQQYDRERPHGRLDKGYRVAEDGRRDGRRPNRDIGMGVDYSVLSEEGVRRGRGAYYSRGFGVGGRRYIEDDTAEHEEYVDRYGRGTGRLIPRDYRGRRFDDGDGEEGVDQNRRVDGGHGYDCDDDVGADGDRYGNRYGLTSMGHDPRRRRRGNGLDDEADDGVAVRGPNGGGGGVRRPVRNGGGGYYLRGSDRGGGRRGGNGNDNDSEEDDEDGSGGGYGGGGGGSGYSCRRRGRGGNYQQHYTEGGDPRPGSRNLRGPGSGRRYRHEVDTAENYVEDRRYRDAYRDEFPSQKYASRGRRDRSLSGDEGSRAAEYRRREMVGPERAGPRNGDNRRLRDDDDEGIVAFVGKPEEEEADAGTRRGHRAATLPASKLTEEGRRPLNGTPEITNFEPEILSPSKRQNASLDEIARINKKNLQLLTNAHVGKFMTGQGGKSEDLHTLKTRLVGGPSSAASNSQSANELMMNPQSPPQMPSGHPPPSSASAPGPARPTHQTSPEIPSNDGGLAALAGGTPPERRHKLVPDPKFQQVQQVHSHSFVIQSDKTDTEGQPVKRQIDVIQIYPDPQLFCIPNFLTQSECDDLLRRLDNPTEFGGCCSSQWLSEQMDGGAYISSRPLRTSSIKRFECHGDGLIATVERRVAAFAQVPLTHVEELIVVRYRDGEFCNSHLDESRRRKTLICFLSDVPNAGEVDFEKLGFQVRPQRGTALLWNNLLANEEQKDTANESLVLDQRVRRGDLPPVGGTKYVLTAFVNSEEISPSLAMKKKETT